MIKLMLNLRKPYNYAFFCPVSRLHLTISSPVGFANEVTSAILRGLKSNVLIDVDGVIDKNTGRLIASEERTEKPEIMHLENPIEVPTSTEDVAIESKGIGAAPDLPAVDNSADTEQENSEETEEKKPAKKSSRGKKK